MLRLSLLRHAKSGWDDPGLGDHARQLTKRGIQASDLMGRYIAKNALIPDLILCSHAVRTRNTLSHILLALEPAPPPQTVITSDLYLATPEQILHVIKANSRDGVTHIMVIGHNPGLQALALSLPAIAPDNAGLSNKMALKYPTAALAHFSFKHASWSELRPATGKLELFIAPRDLAA